MKSRKAKIEIGDWDDVERLNEEEFVARNRSFNKQLGQNPGDIELWIEFVRHQELTHMKSAKLQIVERKLDILDKALRENPSNEKLYKLYVEIIDRAYPSFEVSKILDKLLSKGKIFIEYYIICLYELVFWQIQQIILCGTHKSWLVKVQWLVVLFLTYSNCTSNV